MTSAENIVPAKHGVRPQVGAIALSFAVATFLLAASNTTFWTKSAQYLDNSLALVLLPLGLFAFLSALCITSSMKYVTKPLFIALIFAAAAASWFMDHFGTIIDVEMIRNAAETTRAESGNLITPGFLWHMTLFGLLPSLLVAWVRIDHRSFFAKARANFFVILPLLVVGILATLGSAREILAASNEHRDWFATLNPISPITSAARYALRTGKEKNIVAATLGADARVAAPAGSRPRVLIIVAGETARAQNFSLGGYARPTNPELTRQDITYFPDTTSCGTATAVSIPCMFSVYTHDTYTHSKGLATETLLDVFKHAGIHAEWWDNNTGNKGVADRVAHRSMPDDPDPRFCTDGECQDGILLDHLGPWLDGVKGDSVLVLHQLGSHGPAYFRRYPDAFRRFTPDCRSPEFSDCTNEEIVNAYDNSIAYTDHVLSTVIEELKKRSDRFDGSMIYMSDHGESLGEHGLYLHGAPYFIAPKEQTHVPFVLWLGQGAGGAIDQACLADRSKKPTSHDNLFHTALGLMKVQTSVYVPDLDALSGCARVGTGGENALTSPSDLTSARQG